MQKDTKKERREAQKTKLLIYIKRNPQIFPKILTVVSCCFFTFNLTPYSYSAVDITSTTPAISLFFVCLLSFMSIISFVPVKSDLFKKKISAGLTVAFLAIQIILQISFVSIMQKEIASVTEEQLLLHGSWQTSVNLSIVHLILLFLTLFAVVLMPIYVKLLAKIKINQPDDDDFCYDDFCYDDLAQL